MKTILFILLALLIGYIVPVIAVFKVPASISDSFYLLDSKKKNLGYLFTGWCYLTGILVMSMMFALSINEWYQFLGLFAGGGLALVGAAPLFKSQEKRIHYISATVCAFSALLWMFLSGFWVVPSLLLVLALSISFKYSSNRIFLLEVAVFVSMYIALACRIL